MKPQYIYICLFVFRNIYILEKLIWIGLSVDYGLAVGYDHTLPAPPKFHLR